MAFNEPNNIAQILLTQNYYLHQFIQQKQRSILSIDRMINSVECIIKTASNASDEQEIMTKLTEYVNLWNEGRSKHVINLQDINQCFIQNNVNYSYFQSHGRKDFVQLLRRYNIKISAAINLWNAFTVNNVKTMDIKEMQKIINSTSWNTIPTLCCIYKKNATNSTKMTLSLNKTNFISNVNDFINNVSNIDLIPMARNSEYVWIVRIYENVDIGISLKYSKQNKNEWIINGIFLDKQYICNQLALPNAKYDCLDNFASDIDELIISNTDDPNIDYNDTNDLEGYNTEINIQ